MSTLNYGTYHSAVWVMHHLRECLSLRRELYQNNFPPAPEYKLPFRPIQYRDEVNSWVLFVPFPDGDVMDRSQRYAFQKEKRKPIQTRVYCLFPSLLAAIALLIGSFFFALTAQFRWGVRLMERVRTFTVI